MTDWAFIPRALTLSLRTRKPNLRNTAIDSHAMLREFRLAILAFNWPRHPPRMPSFLSTRASRPSSRTATYFMKAVDHAILRVDRIVRLNLIPSICPKTKADVTH
jgi:hypothetical protein